MARSGVVTARVPNPRCGSGKERSGGEERSGGVVVVARVWRRLPRRALWTAALTLDAVSTFGTSTAVFGDSGAITVYPVPV
eukprot:6231832-Prymnesium_polylepis.1